MAKRKLSNLLALAILALLNERPMHPYEISALMRQRGISDSIKLNYGSLYSVIDVLLREGLIIPQETQREGRHPERTIYAATDAGRTEFFAWLRQLVRKPAKEYTQFAAGLSFIGHLPPAETISLLTERSEQLAISAQDKRTSMATTMQYGVDRMFLIEDEFVLSQIEAELQWVQKIISEIKDGTFTETRDGTLLWKVTNPQLALSNGDEDL